MRIISGKLKGYSLHLPVDKKTRPLKDMARESIFNLLSHSNKISIQLKNSNILDLYAGTGSFGLECLSREANNVFFVENEKSAFEVLKKNINKLKMEKKVRVYLNEVFDELTKLKKISSKFDLIFCDPPFKNENVSKLIELIFNKNLLSKNGIIIIHRNKITSENFPDYFKILDERKYGTSKIIFGKFLL